MGEEIMYKKYGILLLLTNMLVLAAYCSLNLTEKSRYASTAAFQTLLEARTEKEQVFAQTGSVSHAESGQRIIDYQVLEQSRELLSEEEFQILCRIVEAEAGGEDINGRMLVANVVMNRVRHNAFPDTVKGVVFQKRSGSFQFSPVRDGRFQQVTISQETVEAVQRALSGEDASEGALYFVSRKAADPEKMRWFDEHLTRLFQHGGHEFFA